MDFLKCALPVLACFSPISDVVYEILNINGNTCLTEFSSKTADAERKVMVDFGAGQTVIDLKCSLCGKYLMCFFDSGSVSVVLAKVDEKKSAAICMNFTSSSFIPAFDNQLSVESVPYFTFPNVCAASFFSPDSDYAVFAVTTTSGTIYNNNSLPMLDARDNGEKILKVSSIRPVAADNQLDNSSNNSAKENFNEVVLYFVHIRSVLFTAYKPVLDLKLINYYERQSDIVRFSLGYREDPSVIPIKIPMYASAATGDFQALFVPVVFNNGDVQIIGPCLTHKSLLDLSISSIHPVLRQHVLRMLSEIAHFVVARNKLSESNENTSVFEALELWKIKEKNAPEKKEMVSTLIRSQIEESDHFRAEVVKLTQEFKKTRNLFSKDLYNEKKVILLLNNFLINCGYLSESSSDNNSLLTVLEKMQTKLLSDIVTANKNNSQNDKSNNGSSSGNSNILALSGLENIPPLISVIKSFNVYDAFASNGGPGLETKMDLLKVEILDVWHFMLSTQAQLNLPGFIVLLQKENAGVKECTLGLVSLHNVFTGIVLDSLNYYLSNTSKTATSPMLPWIVEKNDFYQRLLYLLNKSDDGKKYWFKKSLFNIVPALIQSIVVGRFPAENKYGLPLNKCNERVNRMFVSTQTVQSSEVVRIGLLLQKNKDSITCGVISVNILQNNVKPIKLVKKEAIVNDAWDFNSSNRKMVMLDMGKGGFHVIVETSKDSEISSKISTVIPAVVQYNTCQQKFFGNRSNLQPVLCNNTSSANTKVFKQTPTNERNDTSTLLTQPQSEDSLNEIYNKLGLLWIDNKSIKDDSGYNSDATQQLPKIIKDTDLDNLANAYASKQSIQEKINYIVRMLKEYNEKDLEPYNFEKLEADLPKSISDLVEVFGNSLASDDYKKLLEPIKAMAQRIAKCVIKEHQQRIITSKVEANGRILVERLKRIEHIKKLESEASYIKYTKNPSVEDKLQKELTSLSNLSTL